MRVLFVAKTLTKGGAASGARNLLSALNSAGLNVVPIVASLEGGVVTRSLRIVERLCERLIFDAETHCLRFGAASADLIKLTAKHKPDVVQLCDVSANSVDFRVLRNLGCPVVHRLSDFWPYHGARHYAEQEPIRKSLSDRLLANMVYSGDFSPTHLVAPSSWLAERLPNRPVSVIRNAVEVPAVLPERRALLSPIRFGFISKQLFEPRKGFVNLGPFIAALHQHGISAELIAFGSASDTDLRKQVADSVSYRPAFGISDTMSVYSSFDILLCPSLLDNSPNVVTEAFSFGVPVIGQSGTGMDSYIDGSVGGSIDFQSSTTDERMRFVGLVQRIVSDYKNYSRRAATIARTEFSPSYIGAQYAALYDKLITGAAR